MQVFGLEGLGEGGLDSTEAHTYACPPDAAVHGVAVLDAIVKSARSGQREPIG